MAYTKTTWETGDVITAELLNHAEQGIENAFIAPTVTSEDEGDILTVDSTGEWVAANMPTELPSVSSADQGMVLTVDSSGDWVVESPSKDVLVITGDLTADLSFNATFTVTSGDMTQATAYKDTIIKAHMYYDIGGDDPIDSNYEYILRIAMLTRSSEDPTEIVDVDFSAIAPIQNTYYELLLEYEVTSGTWHANFKPIAS